MRWASAPLERVLHIADPGVWGPEDPQNGISVLRSTNFRDDGTLDLTKLALRSIPDQKRRKKTLRAGDIVLERSGGSPRQPVGRICYFEGDGKPHVFGNFCQRLRPDAKLIEPRFLFWYLHYLHLSGGTLAYQKQTTGIRNLEYKAYLQQAIPVPPPSEQRRIVEVLDQVDHLRRLRTEVDSKADRLLPTVFIKMFGDAATNPKGWLLKPLGELGELDRGRSTYRPRNDPLLLGGPYPLIQTGVVSNSGGRIREFTETYSELGLAQSRMWPAGTLCITIAANIASTGVLEFDACFPDSVVGFVPSTDTTTEYVQFLLFQLRAALERNAPQLAQKNINLKVLRSLIVPVPPIELQREFSSYVCEYYDSRARQTTVKEELGKLFGLTMKRAFFGSPYTALEEGRRERPA